MKIFTFALVSTVIVSIAILFLVRATERAHALAMAGDCVVKTAQAEGYAGDPHSREAWSIFIGSCVK